MKPLNDDKIDLSNVKPLGPTAFAALIAWAVFCLGMVIQAWRYLP